MQYNRFNNNIIIYRPRTGKNSFDKFSLKEKYERIEDIREAETMWTESYESESNVGGLRYSETNMLSGNILSVWNTVEKTYHSFENSDKKCTPKIAKAKVETADDNVRRFLGINVPSSRVNAVLRNIAKLNEDEAKKLSSSSGSNWKIDI